MFFRKTTNNKFVVVNNFFVVLTIFLLFTTTNLLLYFNLKALNKEKMDNDEKNTCVFCSKEFCSKQTLTKHQKTTKSCLQIQGKNASSSIECVNCKKMLAIESYKKHIIKCNLIFEKSKTEQKEELDKIQKQNKKIKLDLSESKKCIDKLKNELNIQKNFISQLTEEIIKYKDSISFLEKEVESLRSANTVLEKQNDKLHISSANVSMKLAEKKNNVSPDVQTDYRVFYNALNSIIEETGQQNKYTEKCKQQMVRECKRRFLEKNKNKEKMIAKKLSAEEVMMNVIETGGTVHDFVDRFFRDYSLDDEETDEQFKYRREMEDLFRQKKRDEKKNLF